MRGNTDTTRRTRGTYAKNSPPLFELRRTGRISALLTLGLALTFVTGLAKDTETGSSKRGITSLLTHETGRQIRLLDGGLALAVETRSARSITLVLDSMEPMRAASGWRYSLWSANDPRFSELILAKRVGYDRQVVGFDHRRQPLLEHRLHLTFPQSMLPGIAYRLRVSKPDSDAHRSNDFEFVFLPGRVSGSIQVNQVGYAPSALKYAYVGNWLGSDGPMPVDAERFEVIDIESGKVVFRGALEPRAITESAGV